MDEVDRLIDSKAPTARTIADSNPSANRRLVAVAIAILIGTAVTQVGQGDGSSDATDELCCGLPAHKKRRLA